MLLNARPGNIYCFYVIIYLCHHHFTIIKNFAYIYVIACFFRSSNPMCPTQILR